MVIVGSHQAVLRLKLRTQVNFIALGSEIRYADIEAFRPRGIQTTRHSDKKAFSQKGIQTKGIQTKGIQTKGIQAKGIQTKGIQIKGIQTKVIQRQMRGRK